MTRTRGNFVLQTLLCSGQWDTPNPSDRYPTREAAQAELDDQHREAAEAVARGDLTDYSPEEWRVARRRTRKIVTVRA